MDIYGDAQGLRGTRGTCGYKGTQVVRASLWFAGGHKGCNISTVHEPGCKTLFTP